MQLDFNLQGMGHLHLSQVLFRDPLPGSSPAASQAGVHADWGPRWSADAVLHAGQEATSNAAAAAAAAVAVTPGSQPPPVLWTQQSVPEAWRWSSVTAAARCVAFHAWRAHAAKHVHVQLAKSSSNESASWG